MPLTSHQMGSQLGCNRGKLSAWRCLRPPVATCLNWQECKNAFEGVHIYMPAKCSGHRGHRIRRRKVVFWTNRANVSKPVGGLPKWQDGLLWVPVLYEQRANHWREYSSERQRLIHRKAPTKRVQDTHDHVPRHIRCGQTCAVASVDHEAFELERWILILKWQRHGPDFRFQRRLVEQLSALV
jgi:hypothetical protein